MMHKVEIYSLPGCSHCKQAKSFFAKHAIEYTDYDFSDQEMVDKMVGLTGQRNVPVNIIDENCVTSVPGFFAAGDSTSIKAKQIVSSVGEGVKALLTAHEYLKRSL